MKIKESILGVLLGYVIVTLAAICMIKKKSKSVISIKKQNPVVRPAKGV